jgi:hypothetical protein
MATRKKIVQVAAFFFLFTSPRGENLSGSSLVSPCTSVLSDAEYGFAEHRGALAYVSIQYMSCSDFVPHSRLSVLVGHGGADSIRDRHIVDGGGGGRDEVELDRVRDAGLEIHEE